jgi:hypothetical protein
MNHDWLRMSETLKPHPRSSSKLVSDIGREMSKPTEADCQLSFPSAMQLRSVRVLLLESEKFWLARGFQGFSVSGFVLWSEKFRLWQGV